MPDLIHTLQGSDLSFLKMIAGNWGVDLNAPDAYTALPQLVKAMSDRQLFLEIVESLPTDALRALQDLMKNEAHLPWALFQRRYGEVRSMGPGRRDRERPDLNPISPAEVLWYRALIGRGFMNLGPEPQEYAFIPDEFVDYLTGMIEEAEPVLGRPATPGECAYPILTSDLILDDTCTALAALRTGKSEAECSSHLRLNIPVPVLHRLLNAAGLLDNTGLPEPTAARAFLEAKRADSWLMLTKSWMSSTTFNELRLMPGFVFEGEWQNNPLLTRQTILDMLNTIPSNTWWNITSFIQSVYENHPDFQRTAGDYDSWFIRKENPAESDHPSPYLRGFAFWFEIEGALLQFYITQILHWLGFYDLAAPDNASPPLAFRLSRWGTSLWRKEAPQGITEEDAKLTLTSDGSLSVPRLTPRSIRYQIARFCQWQTPNSPKDGEFEYRYRITPASLEVARANGLKISHIQHLLQRYARAVPPNLIQSLERWEKFGSQAEMETCTLLRFTSPEILEALRRTRAARFIGEVLSPTLVTIKPGGETAVQNALLEIGYLAKVKQS